MIILDGKKARDSLKANLMDKIANCIDRPKLVIIQCGDKEESNKYIQQKKKFGAEIGVEVEHIHFLRSVSEKEVIDSIKKANSDDKIHGIIVQLPLPPNLDKDEIIESIHPEKDADGLTSANIKLMWQGNEEAMIPATAQGVAFLLDFYGFSPEGKNVVIIGRSELVGKPIAAVLLSRNATVTICHSKTQDLVGTCRKADILISAAGVPGLVDESYSHANQVIVDVGINIARGKKLEEEIFGKHLVGDVNWESVRNVAKAVSPVPGGVGPLTVAFLFGNVLKMCEAAARRSSLRA
ncbi:MAG: hypothetical protein A3G52_03705 [Candidatus Taylorbacteria bacterium RIFCSPLOWO2_12_FULL_43_20]|uniref:Bifunctional protein FolD n=1 Tax=Candidatus Taylorbacteria bacterium RIFCSPLOWO2_12_FULL_43_20 TaxID=1802332 RepID=A0A1G2NZC7_9BACT|nr:MAG: hypothetical protein A2825_01550 [Candidatus Taylorbacteria bacterium RIFCSPHIGHO2_01_FULL_43_120]OHA22192.1 MAG: hypothetical protein A3B98_01815 [Candidatus Taylorbacteria bacterium RIFCSPHIGHO2_02_FULL_43_55]OHA28042.1 MAG: hypothetical protein A3E92_04915 [Candidatus Taylorbacteria bacterium RIFCSPHIGHO2_12_FULL_42_34]OHA32275.1 MAG: hypothetical protein A3B09_02130 [Candidatus Taylorbacteria bacterium RIFCSPLOWO2_01_FULL_43_83]OHA37868.1 MAG: hypothetical protein A3H58_02160 [Candi